MVYMIEGLLEYQLEGKASGNAQSRGGFIHPGRGRSRSKERRQRQWCGTRHVHRRKRETASNACRVSNKTIKNKKEIYTYEYDRYMKDGMKMYYKDWGTGQPIVFNHGWPLTADAFEDQMFHMASNGYRCVAVDRRGHGRSDQTWHGNDMDTYADDLAPTYRDYLDFKRCDPCRAFYRRRCDGTRYVGRHGTDRIAKAVLDQRRAAIDT